MTAAQATEWRTEGDVDRIGLAWFEAQFQHLPAKG